MNCNIGFPFKAGAVYVPTMRFAIAVPVLLWLCTIMTSFTSIKSNNNKGIFSPLKLLDSGILTII